LRKEGCKGGAKRGNPGRSKEVNQRIYPGISE